MKIYGDCSLLQGGCGVKNIHNFRKEKSWFHETVLQQKPLLGGANLAVACFINTPECKTAYKILRKKFKIIFQSSVRLNENSDNLFFMVVYDKKDNHA